MKANLREQGVTAGNAVNAEFHTAAFAPKKTQGLLWTACSIKAKSSSSDAPCLRGAKTSRDSPCAGRVDLAFRCKAQTIAAAQKMLAYRMDESTLPCQPGKANTSPVLAGHGIRQIGLPSSLSSCLSFWPDISGPAVKYTAAKGHKFNIGTWMGWTWHLSDFPSSWSLLPPHHPALSFTGSSPASKAPKAPAKFFKLPPRVTLHKWFRDAVYADIDAVQSGGFQLGRHTGKHVPLVVMRDPSAATDADPQ